MKKNDLLVLGAFVALFMPFILVRPVFDVYQEFNTSHGFIMSFIKFAILATFGESLGMRIRSGAYLKRGFGILPRALVWGFIGVVIRSGFIIYGEGAPVLLKAFGVGFPVQNPADMLRQPGFSMIKLYTALFGSITINIFFAPVFMAFHSLTDLHIQRTGGTLKGFFTTFKMAEYVRQADWGKFWDFVLKKTVPFFWIPAQTINFMLPEGCRVLVAALYSIILGILLSMAVTGPVKSS